MVTHRTTEVKVFPGRSSSPISRHLFFWQIRPFTPTGTLRWAGNRRLITDVGSNPKLVTFSLLANRYHLLLYLVLLSFFETKGSTKFNEWWHLSFKMAENNSEIPKKKQQNATHFGMSAFNGQ